ncbi:MAG: hypothetical protein AAB926_01915 [Patescibacteria group bacterium]
MRKLRALMLVAVFISIFSFSLPSQGFQLSDDTQQSILGEIFYLLVGAGIGSLEGPHATLFAMGAGCGAGAGVEVLGYFSGQKSSPLEVIDSCGVVALLGKIAEDSGPLGGAAVFGSWGIFDEAVWEPLQLGGEKTTKTTEGKKK